jgi:hypothetical protein
MSEDIHKCKEADDPNRCQAVHARGQCENLAATSANGEYGKYCMAHGGNQFVQKKNAEAVRNYRLRTFKDRVGELADSGAAKGLREEIGILRIMMEERLNKCEDSADLILQSGPISDLAMKIEKVVSSCHKLEGSMGQLLDKSAILQFASEIIDIVGQEVSNDEEIEKVGNRIIAAVSRVGDDDEGV